MRDRGCFLLLWFLYLRFLRASVGIEIKEITYPWLFEEGRNLTLFCEDDTRTTLSWIRNTAGTSWSDAPLKPMAGSNFSIQSCSEEPSGRTKNTLIKASLTLADRGTYKCGNTLGEGYAVYVNVLTVRVTHNITLNQLLIQCKILGFDNNPPSFKPLWTYRSSNTSSPYEIPSSGKYSITSDNELLHLQISPKTRKDAGIYNCSFYYATNTEAVPISGSVIINEFELVNLGQETSAAKSLFILSAISVYFIAR